MEYFALITLELPGLEVITRTATFPPTTFGTTAQAIYKHMRKEIAREYPELAEANVTFFGVWPNQPT